MHSGMSPIQKVVQLMQDIIAGLLDGKLNSEFKHVQFTWNKQEGPQFFTVMDPAYVKKQ